MLNVNMTSKLIQFCDDNQHATLEDCVDFICATFDLDATDALINSLAYYLDGWPD